MFLRNFDSGGKISHSSDASSPEPKHHQSYYLIAGCVSLDSGKAQVEKAAINRRLRSLAVTGHSNGMYFATPISDRIAPTTSSAFRLKSARNLVLTLIWTGSRREAFCQWACAHGTGMSSPSNVLLVRDLSWYVVELVVL